MRGKKLSNFTWNVLDVASEHVLMASSSEIDVLVKDLGGRAGDRR